MDEPASVPALLGVLVLALCALDVILGRLPMLAPVRTRARRYAFWTVIVGLYLAAMALL